MTWLFTQVWLWSLAAFLLGALATWLLFVVPLRRRLAGVQRALAGPVQERPEHTGWMQQDGWATGEPAQPERDHDPTAWDILPVEHWPGPDQDPEPSPDRPFRTGDLSGYWSLRPGAPGTSSGSSPPGGAEAAVPDYGRADDPSDPVEVDTGVDPADDTDIRLEAQRESGRSERADGLDESAGTTQRREDWMQTVRRTPPPSAPPEVEQRDGIELAGEGEQGGNTWFRKGEWADHDGGSAPVTAQDDDAGESRSLSGQLRSLFEPLESSGPDHDRAGVPYNPPVGAAVPGRPTRSDESDGDTAPDSRDVRTDSAAPSDTAEEAQEGEQGPGEDQNPLPRRVPGATSRPGTPPANRPTFAGAQQPPRPAPWPSGGEAPASPPEEWYPDEMNPSQARPDEGYTVKGHFASRLYHTTESPHFERVAAEVWFRTAADAEQAGFEPWDGHRRS